MSGWRAYLAVAGLALLFVVSCLPLLSLPVGVDTYGFYWMVHNLPFWSLATDPHHVGYGSIFFFQPLLVYFHYIDAALVPWLGVPGHHVGTVLGTLASALLLFRMVREARQHSAPALLAAALFLFSSIVWFNVAVVSRVHYAWSVFFALLSIRPAWREHFEQRPFDARSVCLSTVWYGVAVACKESAAALPLLIVVLRYTSTRRLAASLGTVIPHALVLLALLAWRYVILGGLGGYWSSSPVVATNLLRAAPVLFEALWGHALLAVPLILLVAVWRPGTTALAAAGYLTSVLPFIFAMPLHPVLELAARLNLAWALLLLSVASAPLARRWELNWSAAAVGSALLVLQCTRFPDSAAFATAEFPPDGMTPPSWSEPRVVVSSNALWYAWNHQMHNEPKAPLYAYFSTFGLDIDAARGRVPEASPQLPFVPRPRPMDVRGLRYWADEAGHFHLRIEPERLAAASDPAVGRLFMALQYQNGTTHWTLDVPVERARVDFPLSHSIRTVVLFSPDRTPEWPMLVWESPFFIDPYPPATTTPGARG